MVGKEGKKPLAKGGGARGGSGSGKGRGEREGDGEREVEGEKGRGRGRDLVFRSREDGTREEAKLIAQLSDAQSFQATQALCIVPFAGAPLTTRCTAHSRPSHLRSHFYSAAQ